MRPHARTLVAVTLFALVALNLVALPARADAPVAADDAYPTPEDQVLSVPEDQGVLANDSDPDGIPVAQLVADVSHGTLDLQPDGSFTYSPAQDFNGTDTFSYQAFDGPDGSGVATATITVDPVNDPPVGVDDEATTEENTSVDIAVLANDTDPDVGDTLSVDSVTTPSTQGGTVQANVDGTVTYTPPTVFTGDDGFDYVVGDGHETASAHVTVHVTPPNRAPVGVADSYTFATAALTTTAPGVLANDSDVDGDVLHAVLGAGPEMGTLDLHDDGSFDYTPDPGVCQRDDSFTYRVSDGAAQSDPVTVDLHVRIPRQPASLTLTRSATVIPYRGDVTVTAHLSAFSPTARITITRTPYGGVPITLVTRAPNTLGNLRFTATALARRNAFVATSRLDNCHLSDTSPSALVQVRAAVTGTLKGAYRTVSGVRLFHQGTDPFYRATVTPAHPEATMHWIWQRKVGAVWRNYFTPTVGTDSSATGFFLKGTALGQIYRIRAAGPYDASGHPVPDNAPGSSGWILFRITR
jgi:Bacterial Ig domain